MKEMFAMAHHDVHQASPSLHEASPSITELTRITTRKVVRMVTVVMLPVVMTLYCCDNGKEF